MGRPLLLTALLSFGGLALGQSVSSAQSCLSSISNLVALTASSPEFTAAKQPYNLRLSPNPSIIVSPTTVQQIQSIVTCAANSSLSVSAKSGGHSYAAYGLGGDIVIDLSNLKGLTLNSDGTAVVQTGNRLGDVAQGIFNQGQRALAHGSCPYVGSGGHTLYGGFGYFSRIGGLLLDQVVSAQVVLANGTLVTASNTSNTDLFWAIRGGGPSFGIVTAWTYQTVPAPPTTVNYQIAFGTLSKSQVVSAYLAWQSFAATAPKELAMAAVLGAASGTASLSLSGNYYGSQTEFDSIIQPLINKLPEGASLTSTPLGWIAGLEALAGGDGTLNTSKPDIHDTFFAKSLVTTGPSSNASISSWINYLATSGASSDTSWFVQVDLYGGVISTVPANATAFANRDAFLVYQLYASSGNNQPPYPSDGVSFVNGMLAALDPNPQSAYPNYMDPTLSTQQWRQQYFGGNTARLQRIKSAVDPKDVFKLSEGF
ncbi:FAD-binding domain-containing protein [Ramaria rubella]|nr:FAD-binding domain-containing protein [Ramaria rubella]